MAETRLNPDCIAREFDNRDPRSVWLTISLLRKRVDLLETELEECREFLSGQCDVVDGSYGEPAPNKAMQLNTSIGIALYGPGGF